MLRNELKNGNLENWFKCMEICDYIYIFDQDSDDGSKEYYKQFDNCVVIESPTNRFEETVFCKQELLEKILLDHSDVDWIFWIDGDTILDSRLLKNDGKPIKSLLKSIEEKGYDGLRLGHLNLWRSDTWYRVDDLYDYFDNVGRVPFWRNNGKLSFDLVYGIHVNQNEMPTGVNNIFDAKQYKLIHRGFATDQSILEKYHLYKSKGQTGWALDRMINEEGLTCIQADDKIFPEWYVKKDIEDLGTKEKLWTILDKSARL